MTPVEWIVFWYKTGRWADGCEVSKVRLSSVVIMGLAAQWAC